MADELNDQDFPINEGALDLTPFSEATVGDEDGLGFFQDEGAWAGDAQGLTTFVVKTQQIERRWL